MITKRSIAIGLLSASLVYNIFASLESISYYQIWYKPKSQGGAGGTGAQDLFEDPTTLFVMIPNWIGSILLFLTISNLILLQKTEFWMIFIIGIAFGGFIIGSVFGLWSYIGTAQMYSNKQKDSTLTSMMDHMFFPAVGNVVGSVATFISLFLMYYDRASYIIGGRRRR